MEAEEEQDDGWIHNPGKCSVGGCTETRLPFEHSEEVCEQHYFECHRGMIVAWVKERRTLINAIKRLYAAAEVKATSPDGIAKEQKAHAEALVDLFRLAGIIVICPYCKKEIDPEICGCGTSSTAHGNPSNEGHAFVPAGCDCARQ